MEDLFSKRRLLSGLLRSYGCAVIAYSGGVDSTFLTAVAHEVLGDGALAVTAVSPSLARRELEAAKDLASNRGWNHALVGTHEVGREAYARNGTDRCYWCKTELFEALGPLARERGAVICLGTNTDDLGEHRPGLRAAAEYRIASPMAEAGLGKEAVRRLSRDMDLPTAEKPASPCLASRFAYGVRVTPAGLRRVESAEEIVRGFGFEVLRVRDLGTGARIEVPKEDLARAAARFPQMAAALEALGFERVSLDPDGFRSGSLNAMLATPTIARGR